MRFGIAILAFMGFFITNAQRTSIGVAIVCMVNQTYLEESQRSNNGKNKSDIIEFDETCGKDDAVNESLSDSLIQVRGHTSLCTSKKTYSKHY